MISMISIVSAFIAFVILGIVGVEEFSGSARAKSEGLNILHLVGFLLALLVPLYLFAFGLMF